MAPKPWYSKGLRFECSACGNCCRNHGDYDRVYLADRDVEAISAFLGLERERFEAEHCSFEDGWTVLHLGEDACQFLTSDSRCAIYPVRPKQCATWPFWQENLDRERWERDVVPTCPGVGRGPRVSARAIERAARETEEWYEG